MCRRMDELVIVVELEKEVVGKKSTCLRFRILNGPCVRAMTGSRAVVGGRNVELSSFLKCTHIR